MPTPLGRPTPTAAQGPAVAGLDVGKSRLDAHSLPLDCSQSSANAKCDRR